MHICATAISRVVSRAAGRTRPEFEANRYNFALLKREGGGGGGGDKFGGDAWWEWNTFGPGTLLVYYGSSW